MRRPNHASRFEGMGKTKLQASRASDTQTLQSQVNKAAENRLSLSGLEVLHGRLGSKADEIQAERYVSLWPKADIGRVEIPQRSSLLPHRGVLSFRLEAPTAPRLDS